MKLALLVIMAALLTGCTPRGATECFDKVKAELKDPESATISEAAEAVDYWRLDVRAQVPAGGYQHIIARCYADGRVTTEPK